MDQITDPVAALGVFGMSLALGVVKKYTGIADGAAGKFLKPVQPALTMAAGIGLPFLTQWLGIAPVDPAAFTTAPAATVAAVTARETLRRLSGK